VHIFSKSGQHLDVLLHNGLSIGEYNMINRGNNVLYARSLHSMQCLSATSLYLDPIINRIKTLYEHRFSQVTPASLKDDKYMRVKHRSSEYIRK
jgi:hypothetical protein